jgi:hypothetical protein
MQQRKICEIRDLYNVVTEESIRLEDGAVSLKEWRPSFRR